MITGLSARSNATASIEERLAQLEFTMANFKAPWQPMQHRVYLATIGNGNDILTVGSTHYYGLKYPTADVVEVPTLVPPSTDDGCPDGLTIGTLESETGAQTTVWIGTRLRPGGVGVGPVYADLALLSIPRYTQILCRQSITMPITDGDGAVVPVWLPYRVL
jgi:hypothetical protein